MSRAPVGGADWLILEALRAGHRTVPAIADYARVEQAAARAALNRLRTTGQVRRYGDRRGARYIAVKRRKDARR
jgi:DNA-binding MarR family transcriptional regulator